MTGCCSDSGHSSSAQDESERSPSAYVPRRSWRVIRRWCVARTADCFRRASARSSPDRRGRARHLSRPSSSACAAHYVSQTQAARLRIQPCVLCSHRVFSGLSLDGIPVRDFASLALICGDGIVGMGGEDDSGQVVMQRYRLRANENATEEDFNEYLTERSRFFEMFQPFMHEHDRLDRLFGGSLVLSSSDRSGSPTARCACAAAHSRVRVGPGRAQLVRVLGGVVLRARAMCAPSRLSRRIHAAHVVYVTFRRKYNPDIWTRVRNPLTSYK